MEKYMEYAISDGEGTLLAYGVEDEDNMPDVRLEDHPCATMIIRFTDEECQTGK